MKKLLFLTFFSAILAVPDTYAQYKQSISLQSGLYHNSITQSVALDGSSFYEHQYAYSLGLGYQYSFNQKWAIRLESHWQQNALRSTNISSTGSNITEDIRLATLNIPLLVSYSFNKYLFLDLGPVLHFELKNEPDGFLDEHDGLGALIGFGFKYDFTNFSVFAKPQVQLLNIIPLQSSNYQQRLFSTGFLFGLNYHF